VEFQRKIGEFQHQAQREPVEITRHGRRELVLMSADHTTARPPRHGGPIGRGWRPRWWRDAVRRAEMDPEQARLDDLLK